MPETKSLFDSISRRYDLLNTALSLGLDRHWRKTLVEKTPTKAPLSLALDVAVGTAEVAIEISKRWQGYVLGIDPSEKMLKLAMKKIKRLGMEEDISLIQGFAEDLPFRDGAFDTATIAFGIRNTADPLKSLREIRRVLRPGGRVGILEFAVPKNRLFKPFFLFYLQNVLPLLASIVSRGEAYRYLADSIVDFPQREEFVELMKKAGFRFRKAVELTMGTVILYVGSRE